MDYNKLYYFYVVAGYEHITRAAEQLHIAQPSVTKSIKQLEDELGVPLFEKAGRNIRLTFYGRYLKSKLEGIFSSLETIPQELDILRKEKSQTVRINVLSASAVVTDAVIEYKKQNRQVFFHFVQQETREACDISVSTSNPEAALPASEARCIIEEQIFLAVPQRSRYADRRSIELREVSGEGFITLASSRSFRAICDVFCLRAGFRPKIIFESDSPETVKNIIRSNAGIAFWPDFSWGAVSDSTGMRLLPITDPVCQRELIIELHRSEFTSEAAEDFYRFLAGYLKRRQRMQNQAAGTAGQM